tara:strand:- start:157 stop:612 length:456 start_codon:yes stop_codon:yes gene_type:complete
MAFDASNTLDSIAGHLLASGYLQSVLIGEPKSPPSGNQFAACVFLNSINVAQLTLGTTIESHVLTLRIYRNMLAEPTETMEKELAKMVSSVLADLIGEFDLGNSIRSIDVGGQYGAGVSVNYGYLDLGGTMFRIADITLPLIVDDSATTTA